jgi:hypothetical protein
VAAPTSLDALTASARERRAAREPAAEVLAAQSAKGESSAPASPWTGTPDAPPAPTGSEPAPSEPKAVAKPAEPASLAENLLARKKKKK